MNKSSQVIDIPLGPLMVDVEGTVLRDAEKSLLCQPAIGAVILFSRNYHSRTQVRTLVNEIKSLRSPALLIAVDQEGGRVQRFKNEFCTLPPLHTIGRVFSDDAELAKKRGYDCGRLMALELRGVDVDFSFAPVLDTANLDSSVIGDRGFHADPDIITALASSYIDGMHSAGMSATGKHFPGHGGVVEDSHHELPTDNRSMEQLQQHDLVPYRSLANQLDGVMTAHVLFPNIDDALPTYSEYWIQQVLREEIGFTGAVFSDDLTMAGAGDAPIEQRARRALSAGCDMALICNAPELAVRAAEFFNKSNIETSERLLAMAATVTTDSGENIASLRARVSEIGVA